MRYLHLLLLLFCTVALSAQRDSLLPPDTLPPATIHLVAKYSPEGTYLRWGYGEADTWYANLTEGVVLERRRVSPGETEYQPIALVATLPSDELMALAEESGDEMVAAVHGMAYEEWENSLVQPGEGTEVLLDKQDNFRNRHGMIHFAADRSKRAALAAGLGYVDNDIAPDVTYAYRVRTRGKRLAVAIRVVAPVVKAIRPLIAEVLTRENAVLLRWERPLHNRHFSAYFVERAPETGGSWTRLNETPFVQGYDPENLGERGPQFFTYRDSIVNDRPYRYRIIGIDAFGDESAPSPVVIGRGGDQTPPPAPQLWIDVDEKRDRAKTLFWRQPAGEAVVRYHLLRKYGNEQEIVADFAAPGDTARTDSVATGGVYIYRLAAQDAAGNLAWSKPVYANLVDRRPPARPTGLTATVDTSGRVTLTWDEAPGDVFGYYVYATDGDGRAPVRLTNQPHRYRRYVDRVSTRLLNRYRDYYVVATDKDFQYSDKSEVLRVKRPDRIPPAPAQISDFRVTETGVKLSLRPSDSNDAITHRLLRRRLDTTDYTTIAEWTHPDYAPFNYLDTTAVAGVPYLYAYQAVDDGGLKSALVSEVQVATRPAALPRPELRGEVRDELVYLNWPEATAAAGWQLYRRIDDGPETRLPALSGDRNDYLDGRVKPGQTATYRLRLIRQDGRRSPFSQAFEIRL